VAEDAQFNRQVALKRMRSGLAEDHDSRARFISEAQITGYLEHPNIAPVYAQGRDQDNVPFYAMRFVEGKTLEQAIENFHALPSSGSGSSKRQLALRELLGGFVAVCNAVAFAHSREVLHRDLKPRNVVLGPYGETIVVDWGLAKVMGSTGTPPDEFAQENGAAPIQLSQAGMVLGTLSYMSPEQAEPAAERIGPASDIYNLGATLYHLLVGRPPFVHKDNDELRRMAIRGEFPAPREVDRNVPPGLNAIVLNAMARDPAQRYKSATALAQDVERWLADEQVSAYTEPPLSRFGRWGRRNPWAPAFLTLLIAGLFVSTGLAFWALRAEASTRKERNRALQEGAIARAVNQFLNRDLLAKASPFNQAGLVAKPDPDVKLRTVLDLASNTISSRFGDQPQVEASIRQTLGETYQELGLFPQARAHLERALELRKRELGSGDPDTLIALNRMGAMELADGRMPEAETLLIPAAEGLRRILGMEHSESLKAMADVAALRLGQQKLDEAESLFVDLLDRHRSLLGEEHPDTQQALHNLAVLYREQGDAASQQEKPELAKEKHSRSEQLLVTVVAAVEREKGPEHPATLEAKTNLAVVYGSLLRRTDQTRILNEVLEAQRRVLGNKHPDTLLTKVRLGEAYRDQQRFKEAEPILLEAIEGCRAALDRNHETAVTALATLASVYAIQHDLKKLGPVLIEARDITEFRYGPEDTITAQANESVGVFFIAQKEYGQAEPYLRDYLAYQVKNQPKHWKRFAAECTLGQSLLGQRKLSQTKPLLFSAYAGMKAREQNVPPGGTGTLQKTIRLIAQLYHDLGPGREENDFTFIRSDPEFREALIDLELPAEPFARP
jgi:serine/threonine protein kinase